MGFHQVPLTCPGHTRPITDLQFSGITPYGFFLISAAKDGQPMLRQGETGDWIGTFLGHKGSVFSASISFDALLASTGGSDYNALLWDAVTGTQLQIFPHKHLVKRVRFSNDKKRLLTSGGEKLLRIYDLGSSNDNPQIIKGHNAAIIDIAWSPHNDKIFTVCADKFLRTWDPRSISDNPVNSISLPDVPTSLEISTNGDFVTVTYGAKFSRWDISSISHINEFPTSTQLYSASLSPDGKHVVCGGEDGKVYKYNSLSGEPLETYHKHFGPVHVIRFSPDGELYASGSEDGTIRLWQTNVGKTYGLWSGEIKVDNANSSDDMLDNDDFENILAT